MTNQVFSMPVAVPDEGVDPASFYSTFTNQLTAQWTPATGLQIHTAADPTIARLHAPLKAVMRFIPIGQNLNGTIVTEPAIQLQTWPFTFTEAQNSLPSPLPSQIEFHNVDVTSVQTAVRALLQQNNRGLEGIDSIMDGTGILRVSPGSIIGGTAGIVAPINPMTPNRVTIRFFAANNSELNPIQFSLDAAAAAGIDSAIHPLLAQIGSGDWVEVLVLDQNDVPIAAADYELFLSDGTSRTGQTDSHGRIFETGLPAGDWAIDLPAHPSFELLQQ